MAVRMYVKDCKDNAIVQQVWNNSIPDEFDGNIDKLDLKAMMNLSGFRVKGFVGGFEVDSSVLDTKVPSTFIDNAYSDADGLKSTVYTFGDYANYILSNDKKKAVLIIGKTDHNGNRRDVVDHEELMVWVSQFGIDNILTRSAMRELLSSLAYTRNEDTIREM